jgi:preprotein translocase subunit SecA
MIAHWRVRRPQWERARSILTTAATYRNFSDAVLDDYINNARASVMMHRDRPESVDLTFAAAYEAIRREVGISLHLEQILGAIALSEGNCCEMATGEGKTITGVLPAILDGWTGRGVHIITVNDYLAKRDAHTTSAVHARMGVSVGVLQENSTTDQRRRAYAADVTYGADKQFIFDFLRDRLLEPLAPGMVGLLLDSLTGSTGERAVEAGVPGWSERIVMRGRHSALIDEADSVLIDEAVTPAIISLPGQPSGLERNITLATSLVRDFTPGVHYRVERRLRLVDLLPAGRVLLAQRSQSLDEFWAGERRREELAQLALTARELYTLGEDYVIVEGTVQIVDRSTGRVLTGRQWQLGLHQAVEAKEGLTCTPPSRIAARCGYQSFFQGYERLCGMSGTLHEVRHELYRWYRLPVVKLPTHKPVARKRLPDRVFTTQVDKLSAAAARTRELAQRNNPVLLGAWSVNSSQRVSELLSETPHTLLNAMREGQEAEIVARAGNAGTVTVATNMAGRGTDIILSPAARSAGGLCVIATERHDEARVDRQLAGRAGRQGDPGLVETFVSFEDALIVQNGLAPLVWIARTLHSAAPGLGRMAARVLWWQAQMTASSKWTAVRSQVAQAEDWIDMAMHEAKR